MTPAMNEVLNAERLASLREICDDEEDLVAEIAELYLNEMPQLVGRLTDAISAADCLQVRDLAHRIKGASANIGADSLAALFAKVETAALLQALDETVPVLEQIEQLFPRVCEALSAEVNGPAS